MKRLFTYYRSSPMFRWGTQHGIAIGVVVGLLLGALADYLGRH